MGIFALFVYLFLYFFVIVVKSVSLKLSVLISKILFEFEGTYISIVSFLPYYFTLQCLLCCLFGVHFSSYQRLLSGKFIILRSLLSIDSQSLHSKPSYWTTPGMPVLYLDPWNQVTATAATIAEDWEVLHEGQLAKADPSAGLLTGGSWLVGPFGFPIVFLENTDVIRRGTEE